MTAKRTKCEFAATAPMAAFEIVQQTVVFGEMGWTDNIAISSMPHYYGEMSKIKPWIIDRFTRHELWALKMAERMPFFALFFAATLWIWSLPFLPLLALYGVLMSRLPVLTLLPSLIFGMAFFFFVAPWFFRWYFLSAGLMLGRTNMATTKRDQLERQLGIKN
jgi:hypothetical protein